MLNVFPALLVVIVLSNSMAHAACESERSSLESSQRDCNLLAGVSGAIATVGGILGGVLGTLGVPPGIAAEHNCKIKNIKEDDLNKCLDRADEQLRVAEEAAHSKALYQAAARDIDYKRLEEERKLATERRAQVEKKKASLPFDKEFTQIETQYAEAVVKARRDFDFNLQRFVQTLRARNMDPHSSRGKEFYSDFHMRAERSFRQTISSIDQEFSLRRADLLKRAKAAGIQAEAK